MEAAFITRIFMMPACDGEPHYFIQTKDETIYRVVQYDWPRLGDQKLWRGMDASTVTPRVLVRHADHDADCVVMFDADQNAPRPPECSKLEHFAYIASYGMDREQLDEFLADF